MAAGGGGWLYCAAFHMAGRAGRALIADRDVPVNKHDLVFLKHFGMVIAVLHGVMLLLIIGAWWIYSEVPKETGKRRVDETNARIMPLGDSYAGDTGRAALVAAQEAAKAAAAAQVAYEGTLDGGVIYGRLCGACHTSGAGGAPQLTQANWGPRIAQGMDVLVTHAIEGYTGPAGMMPPKGGNPALTDEQVRASVQWMVDNVK